MFVVIEGCDGSGKTTQCKNLVKLLGKNAEFMQFPNRTTEIGKIIDR